MQKPSYYEHTIASDANFLGTWSFWHSEHTWLVPTSKPQKSVDSKSVFYKIDFEILSQIAVKVSNNQEASMPSVSELSDLR